MVVGREQDASSPTHCWEDVLGEVCEECSIIIELGISWNHRRDNIVFQWMGRFLCWLDFFQQGASRKLG